MKLYVDAGTTWSKVCEISKGNSFFAEQYKKYLVSTQTKIPCFDHMRS